MITQLYHIQEYFYKSSELTFPKKSKQASPTMCYKVRHTSYCFRHLTVSRTTNSSVSLFCGKFSGCIAHEFIGRECNHTGQLCFVYRDSPTSEETSESLLFVGKRQAIYQPVTSNQTSGLRRCLVLHTRLVGLKQCIIL